MRSKIIRLNMHRIEYMLRILQRLSQTQLWEVPACKEAVFARLSILLNNHEEHSMIEALAMHYDSMLQV